MHRSMANGMSYFLQGPTPYSLPLSQASDGVGTDTIAVRVTVQDVNDCPPMFVEEVYRVEINENVPQGSSVASVRATDCDDGANAVLRYSIAGGDVGAFELNCEYHMNQPGKITNYDAYCSDIRSHHNFSATGF